MYDISNAQPEPGFLQHLIREEYTRETLGEVRTVLEERGTLRIQPVAHGLFAASPSHAEDSATGYQNAWVRDNIMVANSFRLRGEIPIAAACVNGLTRFFETQIPRFREIIDDPAKVLKEDANRRPHIRFTAHSLKERPESWPHAQNDALGQALWFRCLLAEQGALPFTEADWKIYGLFPNYFEAIEYWQDRDSGAWEESRKVNNSSVGAVVAGLEEFQSLITNPPGAEMPHVLRAKLSDQLARLIAQGRKRLAETLPFEAPPERYADSALLLLIHPLGVVRERMMQDAILNLVQARLRKEVGILRYAGDSYFCQDYDEWFASSEMSANFSDRQDFRDAFLQPGCEAQWCIFDPLLSMIYGERFQENSSDTASFARQVYYFNRSLRQITPDGRCPELYFLKHGRWTPNAHTPLAWTQANLAVALRWMEKSLEKAAR